MCTFYISPCKNTFSSTIISTDTPVSPHEGTSSHALLTTALGEWKAAENTPFNSLPVKSIRYSTMHTLNPLLI